VLLAADLAAPIEELGPGGIGQDWAGVIGPSGEDFAPRTWALAEDQVLNLQPGDIFESGCCGGPYELHDNIGPSGEDFAPRSWALAADQFVESLGPGGLSHERAGLVNDPVAVGELGPNGLGQSQVSELVAVTHDIAVTQVMAGPFTG
jgi:hypothetical protein